MGWVAGRLITVNGTVRNPGDAVPEAEGWPNLDSFVASGDVKWSGDPATKTLLDVDVTDGAPTIDSKGS